jgi:hypothetical protein
MQLPFNRKSPAERVVEKVTGSLEVPDAVKSPGKSAKVGLIATGSLAALTAASAVISSLRRQGQR